VVKGTGELLLIAILGAGNGRQGKKKKVRYLRLGKARQGKAMRRLR
jgi:hypothetical protein